MARLARYAHVQPDEFGRLTPARTRQLDEAVEGLVKQDWNTRLELVLTEVRLLAQVLGRR